MNDREEIVRLVTWVRLTIGYAASKSHVLTKADLDDLYAELCRLSELLDIPTVQEMRRISA